MGDRASDRLLCAEMISKEITCQVSTFSNNHTCARRSGRKDHVLAPLQQHLCRSTVPDRGRGNRAMCLLAAAATPELPHATLCVHDTHFQQKARPGQRGSQAAALSQQEPKEGGGSAPRALGGGCLQWLICPGWGGRNGVINTMRSSRHDLGRALREGEAGAAAAVGSHIRGGLHAPW